MFQKIIVAGNVGADPETRLMPDGSQVTNFSVAVNRRWGSGSDRQEETTWFRVSAWGRQAEVVEQYVRRGMKVLVEGRLRPDPATGGPRVYLRQDGTAGAAFELAAASVTFLSSRAGMVEEEAEPPRRSPARQAVQDEIPF